MSPWYTCMLNPLMMLNLSYSACFYLSSLPSHRQYSWKYAKHRDNGNLGRHFTLGHWWQFASDTVCQCRVLCRITNLIFTYTALQGQWRTWSSVILTICSLKVKFRITIKLSCPLWCYHSAKISTEFHLLKKHVNIYTDFRSIFIPSEFFSKWLLSHF